MQMELIGILDQVQDSINTELQPAGIFSAKIAGILPADVDIMWGWCQPWIARALKHSKGELNSYHIYTALLMGQMQLWVAFTKHQPVGICITEIREHPTGIKDCLCRVVAGDHVEQWADSVIRILTAWAKIEDCDYIVGEGRPGWTRYLLSFGFHEISRVAAKKLKE